MFLKFRTPSTFMLAGPTQSGKTCFVKAMVENKDDLFKVPPVAVKYAYSAIRRLCSVSSG